MATHTRIKKPASASFLKGKTILVTGGTGTFGRACIARLLKEPVKKVIIFSRDELKQSQMQHMYPGEDRLRYFLGDIRDKDRLQRAFKGVDIVIHAAALKQVPATEYNPFEAVKTNIIGSQNVADAAIDCNVSKVLLVSSDKAVEPVNLYGATKLAAEKLVVASNSYAGSKSTALSVIRYGNVIGSRGSLVELIEHQREKGFITLTDERMTRFWISIEQVMEAVLECVSVMKGGEIFVPKMKNAFVVDVIKLLAPECSIKVIGVRAGEKIHETLITQYERARTQELQHLYVISPEFAEYERSWLSKAKHVSKDFQYASGNELFKLTKEESKRLFNV